MKTFRPSVYDIVAVAIFGTAVLVSLCPSGDPGIFIHMLAGDWIFNHGHVLTHDHFLAFDTPRLWIADQWASEIGMFLIHKYGGWPLLHALTIGVIALTYCLVLPALTGNKDDSLLLTILSIVFVVIISHLQWIMRPVILSFLFTSIVYGLTLSFLRNPDIRHPSAHRLWWLPLLFAVWANLHPAFPIGLFVAGILCLGAVFQAPSNNTTLEQPQTNRLKIFFFICVVLSLSTLSTLLTPYGIKLYEQIFSLVGDPYWGTLNTEWKSPNFQHKDFIPFLGALLFLYVGLIFCGKSRISAAEWILCLIFVALSLKHRRYIPFFAIVAYRPLYSVMDSIVCTLSSNRILPTIVRCSRIQIWKGSIGFVYAAVLILALCATTASGHLPFRSAEDSGPYDQFPWEASAYLNDNLKSPQNKPIRVFATPNWGGMLTWALWPKARLFIDDRNSLNGKQRYLDFFTITNIGIGWEKLIEKYRFDLLIMAPKTPLSQILKLFPEWQEVYRDKIAVIYARKNAVFLKLKTKYPTAEFKLPNNYDIRLEAIDTANSSQIINEDYPINQRSTED